MTGGYAAAAALEMNAIAAIMSGARGIASRSYHFVLAMWRAKRQNPAKSFLGPPRMNIDPRDSMLLLGLIYLSGVLWHLDKATGKRSSPLWSLLWPLALWLNLRGKRAKRY